MVITRCLSCISSCLHVTEKKNSKILLLQAEFAKSCWQARGRNIRTGWDLCYGVSHLDFALILIHSAVFVPVKEEDDKCPTVLEQHLKPTVILFLIYHLRNWWRIKNLLNKTKPIGDSERRAMKTAQHLHCYWQVLFCSVKDLTCKM